MKRFAAILGLAFAIALPMAHAQQSPDNQYVAIYSLIQQADALQAAGQSSAALSGYTQALADLQKFQKMFPDWDSKIVGFRLDYLVDKISSLKALSQNAIPTNMPPTPMPANPAANPPPPAAKAESIAAPDMEAEAQLSGLRAQVQRLQSENENLQAKLKEALSARPATADTQEMANAQGQVLSLMKENDLLRACLAKGASNSAAPGELPKLRQALADANKKLAEQTRRADKLEKENRTLQSDAGANALEKSALEKRLRQRPTPSAPAPAKVNDEVKTLRTRLAVDEAKAVPYTAEELALLKASAPAPALAAGSGGQKSAGKLPEGSAELVAEAQRYFSSGDYDKAEADYRRILQRDPNNALALANLAAIELQEGKLADAETHLTAALAQNPDDAYNLSTFGFLKFRQQKFDEAFDALSRAAKLDPQNPQIQNYLGVTLSHKGLRTQAETALRKAIELAPNYAPAHNNLAVIYLDEKPPMAELARWHYQKALDLGQPHNADLEKMLADLGAPVSQ